MKVVGQVYYVRFPRLVTGMVSLGDGLLVFTTNRTYKITRLPETRWEYIRLTVQLWWDYFWSGAWRKP